LNGPVRRVTVGAVLTTRFLRLLAMAAILLMPLRLAEAAGAHPSPHALEVVLDLGHCPGADGPSKLHPRGHAHCGISGAELSLPPSWTEPDLFAGPLHPPLPASPRARGLGPEAPTPPPRRA
jgi:hypothetical protein